MGHITLSLVRRTFLCPDDLPLAGFPEHFAEAIHS